MTAALEPQGTGRILVTRPEPAAHESARKLLQFGFAPVVLPLTRTITLDFDVEKRSFDAITITSASVFRHIAPERLHAYKSLPLFAVGEGTAKAAHDAGFRHVIEGGGDAVRLAATIAEALPAEATILYLAGRVRQPIFEEHVAQTGIHMAVFDVYDTEPIHYGAETVQAILRQGPFVAVLLYSGVAATAFVEIMQQSRLAFNGEMGLPVRFLCISARVADRLPPDWKERALVADHPDEKGLFRLLSKL